MKPWRALTTPLVRNLFPALLGAGFLYLARQPEPPVMIPRLITVSALQTAVLIFICLLVEKKQIEFRLGEVLGWALLFRLLFLASPPSLSDDIYRYAWDGIMVAALKNPYLHAPEFFHNLDLPPQIADILSQVNHPEIGTVYPPAAQLFFGLSQLLSQGVLSVKLLLVGTDILSCWMLFRLTPRPGSTVIYAWCPLAVIECGSSGHIDIVMIALLLLSLLMLQQSRLRSAGVFLGLSIMTKVVPLIFYPLFFNYLRRNYSLKAAFEFSICLLAVCIILLPPFGAGLHELWNNLTIYATRWEFSGFLYNILKGPLEGDRARLILLALLTVAVLSTALADLKFYSKLLLCFLAWALTSATLHPWYLLPAAALLALVPVSTGLILSWTAFLPYFTMVGYSLSGTWEENPQMTFILFFATGLTFLQVWRSKEATQRN